MLRGTAVAVVALCTAFLACGGTGTPVASPASLPALGGPPPARCDGKQVEDCRTRCSRGEAGSCFVLGMLLLHGTGVERDPGRAALMLGKACDGGDGAGCLGLADLLRDGTAGTRDPGRVRELTLRAVSLLEGVCRTHGLPDECFLVAHVLESGRGVKRDVERAAAALAAGCEKGGDKGGAALCHRLASRYLGGEGYPRDPRRAAHLLARACDGGEAPACVLLAGMHDRGEGVARDPVRAKALLDQACRAGSALGCTLAEMQGADAAEEQRAKERSRSFERAAAACRAGNREACRAAEGCAGGDAAACTRLEQIGREVAPSRSGQGR
jgi:TPR repeat protein